MAGSMKRSEEGLSVLRFRRFSTIHLLIALGLLFIAAPFVEEIDGGELIVAGLFPPVMLAVADRKRVLVIAIVFAIHAITGRRINDDVAAFWLVEPTLSFVA
jgi:hypothetical protein